MESQEDCDSYLFGRVLYIRKFKTFAIVKFLVNGNKNTLILKGPIKVDFLKYIRRNDYIYVVGKRLENVDILLHSFKVISISTNLQGKKRGFLHERLVNNVEDISILKLYSKVYADIDKMLRESGYIEIKSRSLQDSFYSGSSRPFKTYSNNSHKTKYLRFSAEPVLKDVVIGGIERAYEFGTVFRNEPDSPIRGEEIRALELCSSNEDLETFKKTVIQLVKKLLNCGNVIESDYNDICKVNDSVLEFSKFKEEIVPQIVKPTVVHNLPAGTSPFIATKEDRESVAKRELLIINGMTIAEIYQNERNPFKQIDFLKDQFKNKRDYDIDYSSYIHSQLFGGPIINISFISLDRVLSLLTGHEDLRDML